MGDIDNGAVILQPILIEYGDSGMAKGTFITTVLTEA